MSAPTFPEAMPQVSLKHLLQALSLWATKASAEADLETIFGPRLNWPSAFKHLAAFRRADFSFLPAIHTLLAADMPGLWGGYSRDTREIFLSAECPEESLSAVLIEEIGHFLDQELCLEETPGEEGALFAATVLGLPITPLQREAFYSENDLFEVSRNGQSLLVEGAKSSGGNKSGSGRKSGGRRRKGKSKSVFSNSEVSASSGGTPSASPSNVSSSSGSSNLGGGSVILPPSLDGNLRINQRSAGDTLVGSQGNDTFVIFDQNVTIDDPYGGTDAVESQVSFSLASISPIENLLLSGASNIDGTGNTRANNITGNSGNNKLDGGLGIDTMSGGEGNDTYYVGSASELVIEAAGGGTDTIITSDRSITLETYANIENIIYVDTLGGGGSGGGEIVMTLGTENDDSLFGASGDDTIEGRSGNDTLEGKAGNDFLDGGEGVDSMLGGLGNDSYFVDHPEDRVVENSNSGVDVVFTTVSHTLAGNVENLVKYGDAFVTLVGNSLSNQIDASGIGSNTLFGGAGNDTLLVDGSVIGVVDGGADTDTVVFLGSSPVSLDDNTPISNSEILDFSQLSSQAAATLAANFSGLQSLIGSSGADTITAVSSFGNRSATLAGGDGNDRFVFSDATQVAAASVDGGAGQDTLAFSGPSTLVDSNLSRVRTATIEVLEQNGAGNTATLGSRAQQVGIRTVLAGTGGDVVNASAYTASLTIDASRNKNSGAGLVGSTLVGGLASDSFLIHNHAVLAASSIVGGAGSDTIRFAEDGITVTDDLFKNNLKSVEALQTGNGTNYLRVAENATLSGLASIVGGSGSDTVDASGFGKGLAINVGGGNDFITLQQAGTDLLTLQGGEGSDTLAFAQTTTLVDAQFAQTGGLEVLIGGVDGGNSFTLGAKAQAAGIRTVIGGDATLVGQGDTLDVSAYTVATSLDGGLGDDSLVVGSSALLQKSAVSGGEGQDTLTFKLAGISATDADFAGVQDVEAVRVLEGNNRIVLGSGGSGAGIVSLLGGAGHDTLSVEGYAAGKADTLTGERPPAKGATLSGGSGANSLVGGAGDDVFVDATSSDTLAGGEGTNTLLYASQQTNLVSSALGDFHEVQRLQLSEFDDKVVVDSAFEGIGVREVLGGGGKDSIDAQTASFQLTLSGGKGADTLLAGSASSSLTGGEGNDSIVGGIGSDSVTGCEGNDTMLGQAGNDYLAGDALRIAIDSPGSAATFAVYNPISGGASSLASFALAPSSGIVLAETSYQGKEEAAGFVTSGINWGSIRGQDVSLPKGIVLTTGKASTGGRNLDAGESTSHDGTPGSYLLADLLASVFDPTVQSRDASVLEFTFTVSDPAAEFVSMDILFASEEFPKFTNSYPDIAAVYVDGVNYGFFGNDATTPLSALQRNVDAGFFIDNTSGELSTVYNGITAPLVLSGRLGGTTNGVHTIRIVIADTNDRILDSAIFVSNIRAVPSAELGARLLQPAGDDSILGGAGNDTILGDGGKDTLLGEEGNDFLDGGLGADSMSGGLGDDTFFVDNSGDVVDENSGEGIDVIETAISYTLGVASSIEILKLTGTRESAGVGNAESNTLLGNSMNNSLSGLGGNDSLFGGAGVDTLVGGEGNDSYFYDGADSIVEAASEGTDWVTSSTTYTLTGNVEGLALTGDDTINATGNALDNTLVGNLAGNVLDGGAGVDSLVGAGGSDTYVVDNAGDMVSETDTSTLTGGVDLVRSSVGYTLSGNVENLIYTGSANASLGGNSLANLIDGSAGGVNTLTGGAGDDTYVVNGERAGRVVENVGGGTDIVRVLGENAVLNNPGFANVETYDLSQLTGQAAVTLGGNATGLQSLVGSAGGDTISSAVALGAATLDAGAGDDRFVFDTKGRFAAASLEGGAGSDTLALTQSVTGLVDADLARVSGVEMLSLTGAGNTATLGGNAEKAGIRTVVAGEGNARVDVSGYAATTGVEVRFRNDADLASSTVTGGAGSDTVAFTEDGLTVRDSIFSTNIKAVDALRTANGTNFIALGAGAKAVGLDSVFGGSGSDTVDASAFTSALVVDAGAGADLVTLQNATGNLTIAGGAGVDTLGFAEKTTLVDTQLANVSGVEVLIGGVDGGNQFTLGAKAQAAGIRTVIGGDATLVGQGDTLDVSAYTVATSLDGGLGDDSLVVGSSALLQKSAVSGGEGQDTLTFKLAGISATDADFAGVQDVEAIRVLEGNNRIVLGSGGSGAGIVSLLGGAGHDTLSVEGYAAGKADTLTGERPPAKGATLSGGSGANSLVGGAGDDVFVDATSSDTLAGGEGTNTALYTVAANLGANDFKNYRQIQNLRLSESNDLVVLGLDAEGKSFNSVEGRAGNDQIDASGLSVGVSLSGGLGDDNLIGGTASDTLDGGEGSNMLAGGLGSDFYVIKKTGDSIVENAGEGTDTAITHVDYTLTGGVERLVMATEIEPIAESTTGTEINLSTGLPLDIPADLTSLAVLYPGSPLFSAIETSGDVDWIKVNLIEGTSYRVDMRGASSGGGTLGDSFIDGVYYIDGTRVITGNDDSGIGLDSAIQFTAPTTGEFFVRLRAYSDTQVGTYTLEINGVSNLRGVGNSSDNTLVGNAASNELIGGGGNDSMDGGAGVDTLIGGDGSDTLQGGVDDGVADSLFGGAGNDRYVVNNTLDLINDIGGTDIVESSVTFNIGASNVFGIENLVLTGAAKLNATGNDLANSITGNVGDNSLDGGAGKDTLVAGEGNDTLNGGVGDSVIDSLVGGAGDDLYILDSALDIIVENVDGGNDAVLTTSSTTLGSGIENLILNSSLTGAAANINGTGSNLVNRMEGNSGNNNLDGGGGSDTILGNGGNDILQGGASDGVRDYLTGGTGNDRYIVDSKLDILNDLGGNDTVESSVSFNLADPNVSNIENLIYTGNLVGGATLEGSDSDNNIKSITDTNDTLFGKDGNDTLDGGAGTNSLVGGDGDDLYLVTYQPGTQDIVVEENGSLNGLDEIRVSSGEGVEKVDYSLASNVEILTYSGSAQASLFGSNSDNTVRGSAFGNTLQGLVGNDYLVGGNSADSIEGGVGDDTLEGRSGSDTLNGGLGDDFYIVDSQSANVQEIEDEGSDTVRSTANFSLGFAPGLAQVENLYLVGSANLEGSGNSLNNSITGNDGANTLSAGDGNDSVLGGLGQDLIRGEAGNDLLFGGGSPQADLPQDRSTAVSISQGQIYTGTFDMISAAKISNNDVDWIRTNLKAGIDHIFEFSVKPAGDSVDLENSYFGISRPRTEFGETFDGIASVDYGSGDFYDYGFPAYIYPETSGSSSLTVRVKIRLFTDSEIYLRVFSYGPAVGSYTLMFEGSGSETNIIADNGSNTLIGGLGSDTLRAGNGRDTLGAPIGDILIGGTNNLAGLSDTDTAGDTLLGDDGGDVLDGGRGIDSMVGGKGNDTYFVDESGDKVVESLDGGAADLLVAQFIVPGATFDVDLEAKYQQIEHASLGGAANLSARGNRDANSLFGNDGKNTLFGAEGDDTVSGGGGNDSLEGYLGQDYLDGGSGDNTLVGGAGSDTYIVNSRYDRVVEEIAGVDGGIDHVRTYFNFDPIQGTALEPFQPDQPDNSPSVTKSPSFASTDLASFVNLEHFTLLGQAAYGVGNSLDNSIRASNEASALIIGQGGNDTLIGALANDSLFGDTPDFYASPDIYAPAPTDTRTQTFLDGVVGDSGNDYLDGGAGDNYLDGGSGFDTMVGGAGNDTFVQDNVDDYIVAGAGANELITSVNINQAPDGISKLMLVVAKQASDSGQSEVASFASIAGTKNGNNRRVAIHTGTVSLSLTNANTLELMYAPREGEVFANVDGSTPIGVSALIVGDQEDDLSNPGKFQYDLSWTVGTTQGQIERSYQDVVGYVVKYKRTDISGDIWHTYVNGKSQDFQGTYDDPNNPIDPLRPTLTVTNLEDGTYDFQVTAIERTIPALQDGSAAQHVTLQGGAGNDAVLGLRLTQVLPGGLVDDAYTDPLVQNNPNFSTPLGFIFNPAPYDPTVGMPDRFASYLDGGFGNDILNGDFVNDRSGDDYTLPGGSDKNTEVTFKGLNTLVGGQGSDTFVVKNGGNAIGDEFDWVVKHSNETPVVTQAGNVGSSLNGGQHNLVVSRVDFLTLSDELVNQGKFIDQLALAEAGQFGQGNRLDNYIYDSAPTGLNTLVGDKGRDSIVGAGISNVLIGGTAYGVDQVGLAVKDFTAMSDGGNGLKASIFRDTDPIPVSPNAPGTADPSQFWFVPGYYGGVYDPNRNQDTLVANDFSDIDGGAGRDSMVGSESDDQVAPGEGDMFYVSQGFGGNISSHLISIQDAVFGNGGNDTVTFTDSDYLWWSGHLEGSPLDKNSYTIAPDISNLILQVGSPSARNAIGNETSKGHYGQGSNIIEGNEFDNILNGKGVGGSDGKGEGVDILIGGSGKDNFIVGRYNLSETNKWEPSITDYKEGPDAGFSIWTTVDSVYTDADYVVIDDFEAGDNLELSDAVGGYWIGAAPDFNDIRQGYNNNIPLLGYLQKPNATRFGIYSNTGKPNLVAIVNLSGGLSLDTLALDLAFDPAPSNRVLTGSSFRDKLGWGTFWKLEGSNFSDYVNQDYIQKDSIALLSQIFLASDTTFQGGIANDTFNGFDGNDTLNGGGGNDTLLGGDGQDSLLGEAGNDSLLGEEGFDIIEGGDGNDTLLGGIGNDTLLGGEGNDSLLGEAGNDYLDGGSGINALLGGEGNDTLVWSSVAGNIFDGEDGVNSLLFLAAADLDDDDWGSVFNFQNLLLTDAPDSIAFGTNFENNANTTIIKSAGGNDSLDGSLLTIEAALSGDSGDDTLLGGSNNDSLFGGTGNDSIIGNAGNDTILGEAGNDIILGGDGNDSLIAGSGNDTIHGGNDDDLFVLTSSGLSTLFGEGGDDQFQFNSGAELIASSIRGGAGEDSLVMTSAYSLSDTQFAKISEVEVIDASTLSSPASVVLGVNAWSAGITSLFGGSASDYLSASGYTSGAIYIQGGTSGTLGDTLESGMGASKSTLVGNDESGAANYYLISEASLLGNNTITGGANSNDYLVINNLGTLTDSSFANVTGLDTLTYNNLQGNFLNLGANLESAFDGDTIYIKADVTSGVKDTIDLSEVKIKKVYLDAANEQSGAIITAGGIANTIIGGQANGANDLLIFKSAGALQNSSIMGGGGIDTLRLSANAQTLPSATLSGISGIDVLDIAGAGNIITLAGDLGITSIIGGTGPNTIDASAYDPAPFTLYWDMQSSRGSDSLIGGESGNLFQIKNGANLLNSQISGNNGSDAIQLFSGAQTLGDEVFANISDIEKLQLGSAINGNSITLGTIAADAGIATVIGGTRKDTIDATAFDSAITIDASASSLGARLIGSTANGNLNTLIGGSAGGNEFVLGAISTNSLVGGSDGLDTLTLTQGGAVADAAFTPISKIGTLKLEGTANTVTLGTNALIAGIRTLVGGEGLDDGTGNIFNTSAYGSAGVLFQITDQDYLSNVTAIIGGTGVDTLKFSRDGVSVTDENVANLTNIDVLRTANGNNHFLIHDDFVAAGIDSIIGGTGRDTINMSDDSTYTPTGVADMITMDMSAGSGYTLISSTANFPFAKVIGGTAAGSVIIDGMILTDANFANMYQANIGTLFMRSGSDNTAILGVNARGSGLETLTMSVGNDDIDVTGFLGALAVNGVGGNDVVDTSFAALANLTFTGGDGDDTLRLVGAEARSITSLAGSYEAFALESGNNFVILANDAGLSTIYGGSGVDTISMLNNTTGINFVMDATRLGNTPGFASLDGGSGSDMLTVHGVAGGFADTQFARVGSVNWAEEIGAIENFETEVGANQTYTFGTIAYLAGIQNVYANIGDVLDASGFTAGDPATDRALNFVFATAADAAGATVTATGAAGRDTLTLTTDAQTVDNATMANKLSVETLVLANGANIVALDANANTAGLRLVIGGTGNDQITKINATVTTLVGGSGNDVFNYSTKAIFAADSLDGGAGSNRVIFSTDAQTFIDTDFDRIAASTIQSITTANGANNLTLGANAVAAGIDTVTGGTGDDTFDATAYTIASTLSGDAGNDSLLSGTGNDSLTGGNGTDWLQGTSASSKGVGQFDTLTGGAGIDTFILGDSGFAYYNSTETDTPVDYAVITDFANGDLLQLKTIDNLEAGNGYIVLGVGGSKYQLYLDTDKSDAYNSGDNLIAEITSSVVLTTVNLKSTHGSFV